MDIGREGNGAIRQVKTRNKRRVIVLSYRCLKGGKRYLPPVFRGILGLVIIAGGVMGFLPVLGFWMVPLGLALLATDIPPLQRWFIKQLNHYRRKVHTELTRSDAAPQ